MKQFGVNKFLVIFLKKVTLDDNLYAATLEIQIRIVML
jgi:hypothetical protein